MNPNILNSSAMTAEIIGSKPNTYTFTKALGEVALQECGALPLAIVRPSIVTAAWREPLPGWVENLNGPTGIIAGAGKGLLRTVHCKRTAVADLVPVDMPINLGIYFGVPAGNSSLHNLFCAALCAAWSAACRPSNSVQVYNCTSGCTNPVRWGDFELLGIEKLRKFPMENIVWYPGGSFKENRHVNKFFQVGK